MPRCLFPKPLPQDMLTVSACVACNNAKSRHDDFFRDILVTDVQGAESPIADSIFQNKVLSSNRQGKSLLGRIALGEGKDRPILDDEGMSCGTAVQFSVSAQRMDRTLEFLVRGLRYGVDGFRFERQTGFMSSRLLLKAHVERTLAVIGDVMLTPLAIDDGRVFHCLYAIAQEAPNSSIWLIRFYERVVYRVVTRALERER